MIRLIFFIVFLASSSFSQSLSISSWNLKDFGQTKSDEEIAFIARTVKDFDIIAIQEVVAGDGGIAAVEKLHSALLKYNPSWDYTVSAPTSSSSYKTERYAFFWKKDKVTLSGDAWLEKKFNLEIDREPYLANFSMNGKEFALVNFHAITKSEQPETEIKYFKSFPDEYPYLKLIFCGDFNLPQSHSVFNPLRKMGYEPALTRQKTSLRDRCLEDGCLASEFDNFFLKSSDFEILEKGVVHFYRDFNDFEDAREISDHVPVFIRGKVK